MIFGISKIHARSTIRTAAQVLKFGLFSIPKPLRGVCWSHDFEIFIERLYFVETHK